MFTGIIEELATLESFHPQTTGARLRVPGAKFNPVSSDELAPVARPVRPAR